jgi:hypothetical protein
MAAHLIAADRFGHFLGINGLCALSLSTDSISLFTSWLNAEEAKGSRVDESN